MMRRTAIAKSLPLEMPFQMRFEMQLYLNYLTLNFSLLLLQWLRSGQLSLPLFAVVLRDVVRSKER